MKAELANSDAIKFAEKAIDYIQSLPYGFEVKRCRIDFDEREDLLYNIYLRVVKTDNQFYIISFDINIPRDDDSVIDVVTYVSPIESRILDFKMCENRVSHIAKKVSNKLGKIAEEVFGIRFVRSEIDGYAEMA